MMRERALAPWQTPWSALSAFQQEMNDLFTRFFGEEGATGGAWGTMNVGYAPQIESCVKDKTLYLKADLPGMDPKEVEVTVEGNRLTLRGERKADYEGHDGAYVHREVRYGSFARSFELPTGVKAEDIQASYRNGVLELTIPLPESLLPKKVPVAVEHHGSEQRQIGATS